MKKIYILIIIMLALTTVLKAQVSEQEFQALKALYNATGGNNWTNRTGWENINTTATKDDVTTAWAGIEIIEDGHIIEITFHNEKNNISGQLPPEIGNLVWLKSLDIANNNITGILPAELGNLVNLEAISLSDNNINGPLPSSLANLVKLRTIYFSNNPLNCPFPNEIIFHWVKLYNFQVSFDGLTGEINLNFELFPDLYIFQVYENQLIGEIPQSINKIKNLYSLDFRKNNLTGTLPTLDSCISIRNVNFSENNFTGTVPLNYNNINAPNSFFFNDNNLTGSLPVSFVSKVGKLYCSNNYFSFEALEPIAGRISTLKIWNFETEKLFPLKQNTFSANVGETLTLNASTLSVYNLGGNNNRYKWFRNDVEVYSGNSPIYSVPSASAANAGLYHFEVTNTVVTGITLKSENITVSVAGSNQPPTNIAISSSSINEEFTGLLGTLSATDSDASDTHTFTLATGNGTNDSDNYKFTISGNQLTLNTPANFETTPTLNILISVNDGNGGIFTKAIVIKVNNVNEAPVYNGQITNNTIDENAANGTTALTLLAQDPEGSPVTFSIIQGNNDGAFSINGNKLIVADNTKFNYDTKNSYPLMVSASDGTLSSNATLTINLNKINSMPVVENAVFVLDENSPNGTVVGSIVASDREGDPLTLSFLTGNELSALSFSGKDIVVANSDHLDFEQHPVFNITFNVSDGISNVQATITINLNNLQEATENYILTFSVPEMMSGVEIDNTDHTIHATVISPNLSELIATFTLSTGATSTPASGTIMNFTTPQTITVTAQSGNVQAWVVTVTSLVGKNELNNQNVKIYPNPTNNSIRVSGLIKNEIIKLISLRGEVLSEAIALNETEIIDLQSLKSGIYFVMIGSDSNRRIEKIVKQ
jgi:hypothetical protein